MLQTKIVSELVPLLIEFIGCDLASPLCRILNWPPADKELVQSVDLQ